VRLERIAPGRRPPDGLAGAVLTRDLAIGGGRWSKGRRLSVADLDAIAGAPDGAPVTVLCPDPGEVHEDEAGLRLAAAVAGGDPSGAGVAFRGPSQSRVDLVATVAGVVEIRLTTLERMNRLDPLEVFTVFDGQVVAAGDLVASVKVGPHLVAEATLAAGEALAAGGRPVVSVRAFRPVRIAVLVKEHVTGAARARFEGSVRAKVAGLGATLTAITYVPDEPEPVRRALATAVGGRSGARIALTAGGASTDPADPFFLAVEGLGGRIVRHGVPSHPGSMLWLGRIGGAAIIGLPSCGAFSKATAADLLLPRLVAGQPATAATVARLGHGGILTRSQRFRFPAYARDLDAPDG
jgi:Probable molybdopterin binding domain